MIAPSLIASTPFNNRTALADLAGIVTIMHQTFAETIARNTGRAVKNLPLGSGYPGREWLDALTKQSASERLALGMAPPTDFTEFDVHDPAEWASFVFLLGNDLEEIRATVGVV